MNCNVPAGIHGCPAGCIFAANPFQAGRVGDGSRVGDPRQTGSRPALARVPAGARAPADRRCSGRRQDHAGAGAGALGFMPLSPPAVHQRHAAERRSGRHHLQRPLGGVRIQARADLHQLSAGRRDQPHHAQDAIGAARSHERRAGHHRRASRIRCPSPSW